MYFKQFYLACLAHASYLIGSEGEACVVDPQRDIEQYLTEAKSNGLAIKYIFETHLHADFVSGHKELAEATGATIVFSDQAKARFKHEAVADGAQFKLGDITLKVIATPGHTPESICLLVEDKDRKPLKLLTGDTLFIGDVGRPDLVGKCGFDSKQMAGMLYDSLHNKIMTLPDATEVYPAHGAGSLCGKNISTESSSTIGNQRKFNYALQPMTKEQFIEMLTAQLPEVPAYFPLAVEANRSGAVSLVNLKKAAEMHPKDVQAALTEAAKQLPTTIVLDTRAPADFGLGHIPGAYSVGLGGQFASWCGTVIDAKSKIILVLADDNQVNEAVLRLARAGLENVVAYLAGGMNAWQKAGFNVETVEQITVEELAHKLAADPELRVIDVRRAGEYASGHVPQAKNISLSELEQRLEAVERGVKTAVICAGGYRSSMATSLLKRHGIDELYNVIGGTTAWVNAKLPVLTEAAKCSAG
ncbi:rhodanese-like domain-containing protein [soil metagenome]